jgi:hypothetical protein
MLMLKTELNAKIKIMAVWTSFLTKISEEIKKYVGVHKENENYKYGGERNHWLVTGREGEKMEE